MSAPQSPAQDPGADLDTPVSSPPTVDEGAGVSVPSEATDELAASAAPGEQPRRFDFKKFFLGLTPLTVSGVLIYMDVPLCPAKGLLGIPCPGCGLTRATEAMVSGDFAAMLRYHPLAPIITPMVLYSVARVTLISAGVFRTPPTDWVSKLPKQLFTTLAILLIGLYFTRAFGLFGGLPDPIDPTRGWFYRGLHFIFVDLPGALF